jgi:hypothetical protein
MSEAQRPVWYRRALAPVVAQLRQGITPEQIALTLALATVLGIFPILGATTILCGTAALLLRLNQPLIQAANYLLTPLHLALLLPFYRAGETLFSNEHVPIFSVDELLCRLRDGRRLRRRRLVSGRTTTRRAAVFLAAISRAAGRSQSVPRRPPPSLSSDRFRLAVLGLFRTCRV